MLWKKLSVVDLIIVLVIVLVVLGVVLVRRGAHVTSGAVVQGETDIQIVVQILGLETLDTELFKPGEKTSITIRNQPRGEVTILRAQATPMQVTLLDKNGNPTAVRDLARPHAYNFTVWLKDRAKITQGGYVAEGVKVKVGLPIELEGFNYRVSGRISDVRVLE